MKPAIAEDAGPRKGDRNRMDRAWLFVLVAVAGILVLVASPHRAAPNREAAGPPPTAFAPGGKPWTLEDLVSAPAGPEMERAFAELEAATAAVEATKGALANETTIETFRAVVRALERAASCRAVLRAYADLWTSADGESAEAWALADRVDAALVEAENRLLFAETWWTSLEDETAERLLPGAGDAACYYASLRRLEPYALADDVEQAIRVKDADGINGLLDVYDTISGCVTFEVALDGEMAGLTRGELMALTRDPDPALRAAAYAAQFDGFAPYRDALAQIYLHVAGTWVREGVSLRGYATPIAVRNVENDFPDEVVDAMLAACRESAGLYQRFFRLKAAWIGVDVLSRSDVYAPLDPISFRMTYDEGANLVSKSLSAFSPQLGKLADRVLGSGHVDSEIRPEKYPGAFCQSVVPGKTPWISLSFTGRLESVESLAHETGHAVHELMAGGHSVLTYQASPPLAETASIFSQMLVFRQLLAGQAEPALRRYLLAKSVDTSYTAILRQAYFTFFEQEAHRLVLEGTATPDALADAYFRLQAEQFGTSVDVDPVFRWEWITIPQIYQTPFYCYSYVFGQLLSLALMHQYDAEGVCFVPRFLQILERGGTEPPIVILEEAGIDVRSKEFWRGGFDEIARMIAELERLSD
jgi:oligoendopeptidase F